MLTITGHKEIVIVVWTRLFLISLHCLCIMDKSTGFTNNSINPTKKLKKVNNDADSNPNWDFPTSIEDFGYKFNSEGQLRHIETNEPYEFSVTKDNLYNQKRYEAMGELINEYVYTLLETEGQLKKTYIPIDAPPSDPRGFIFTSDDALTNPDKLLILIHGSGVVRAGQWARRLIINDCLDSGTQLPFIKRGLEEGYAVIVLNCNFNNVNQLSIKGSATAEEHASYVWQHFVSEAKARHIAIVAHSYGGVCTIDLMQKYSKDMEERVFAIAMTDSVHNLELEGIPHSPRMKWLRQVAKNWVSSQKALDEPVASYGRIDIYKFSAGTSHHEMTSWSSFKSIFKFFDEMYRRVTTERAEDSAPKDNRREF